MRDQACTAQICATGYLATLPRLHVEWSESAHGQTDEIQVSDVGGDVGGFGALVTAIVVLCTCVLLAVLSAALMLVS
jgi:hypothetical protein